MEVKKNDQEVKAFMYLKKQRDIYAALLDTSHNGIVVFEGKGTGKQGVGSIYTSTAGNIVQIHDVATEAEPKN